MTVELGGEAEITINSVKQKWSLLKKKKWSLLWVLSSEPGSKVKVAQEPPEGLAA